MEPLTFTSFSKWILFYTFLPAFFILPDYIRIDVNCTMKTVKKRRYKKQHNLKNSFHLFFRDNDYDQEENGNMWQILKKRKKIFMAPFYIWHSTASRLQNHYEEAVYFLPLSSQKFLLILSTSKGWKAESILEHPSGFKHGTPGLGFQCLNH